MKNIALVTLGCIIFAAPAAVGQKVIRGLVVDSLTMDNLPGVTVKVKRQNRGTITDASGIFVLNVSSSDTLEFSSVGYWKSELAAQPDEEIMFVKMREASVMLNEVIIRDRSTKFIPDRIISPTLSGTRPLKAAEGGAIGAGVNFAYFTKAEKEKRKLVAVLQELERVRVYEIIVNDPDFKYDMMEKYKIGEAMYFEKLALFNQLFQHIVRSGDRAEILNNLHAFFGKRLRR